ADGFPARHLRGEPDHPITSAHRAAAPSYPPHESCAMKPLLRLSAVIDRLNENVGRLVSWLVVLMVLIASYNAIVRYLGRYIGRNFSSNAYLESQWYLFSVI